MSSFQLAEAREMAQVSFGGIIKVLLVVGIKGGGGRKGGDEVAGERCFCAAQDGWMRREEFQPCETERFFSVLEAELCGSLLQKGVLNLEDRLAQT